MRLVRDTDDDTMLMNEQDEDATAPSGKRARRKRAAAADQPDAEQPATDEPAPGQAAEEVSAVVAEQADGAVEDGSDGDGGDDASAAASVNLALLEALLFSTHHPLTAGRLGELLDLDGTKPVRASVKALNKQYEDAGRSFRVEQVAGGYQLLTLPEFGEHLKKLHQREADAKLTKAALETLAIIAYKQPILRADVEAIRGVACGETIRSLMEKHLVKIAGRAEEPGRPILYGTTKRFLELFGLNSLKDLPQNEDPTNKPR